MPKDEKKLEALRQYEQKVKEACAIRNQTIEVAKATCYSTIDEAHKEFRRIVDGTRQTVS